MKGDRSKEGEKNKKGLVAYSAEPRINGEKSFGPRAMDKQDAINKGSATAEDG